MRAALLMTAMPLLAGSTARAHHAFAAEFDVNSPVNVKGIVTKVELINPHAYIHLRETRSGKPTRTWMVEAGPPNTLLRAGINRNTLKIGTEAIARGYQSRDHSCDPECKMNGRDLRMPDGTLLFVGTKGNGAPDE